MAVASLVLGIGGWLICPGVCHVLAVIIGNHSKANIRTNPSLSGEGMAQAGVVLGWVGIALIGLVIGPVILLGVLGGGT